MIVSCLESFSGMKVQHSSSGDSWPDVMRKFLEASLIYDSTLAKTLPSHNRHHPVIGLAHYLGLCNLIKKTMNKTLIKFNEKAL